MTPTTTREHEAMTDNRYRRAREQAGLTIAQAVKLCGFNDRHSLEFLETHTERRVTEGCERIMADVYGCSVEWLRGDHVEPPAELVRVLRDADVLLDALRGQP